METRRGDYQVLQIRTEGTLHPNQEDKSKGDNTGWDEQLRWVTESVLRVPVSSDHFSRLQMPVVMPVLFMWLLGISTGVSCLEIVCFTELSIISLENSIFSVKFDVSFVNGGHGSSVAQIFTIKPYNLDCLHQSHFITH